MIELSRWWSAFERWFERGEHARDNQAVKISGMLGNNAELRWKRVRDVTDDSLIAECAMESSGTGWLYSAGTTGEVESQTTQVLL